MRLIFDTHLDLAWNAVGWDRDLTRPVAEINLAEAEMRDHAARGHATVSLPEMRRGGVAVCLATVLARVNPQCRRKGDGANLPERPGGCFAQISPVPFSLDHAHPAAAHAAARGQLAYYRLLEAQGEVTLLHTAADLASHWQRWQQDPADDLPVGIILAMEGADPIVSPEQAEAWWADGLRSLSLAHYGRGRYAVGTGRSGPLAAEGRRLLMEMDRLGMVLDVTHLAEPGFSEALGLFRGPVMASHNNCRALVPGDRQFSDEQIRRLIERDAVIGVALDAWMLYPGWEIGRTSREVVGIEAVGDHVDHICQLAGDCRHVGIGSDLDGGYGTEQTPTGLDTIADLQKLAEVLAGRGYSEENVDAVFHGNWLRFFRRHLPP